MNRRTFLKAAGSAVAAQAQSARKPNIIFILADDLGIGGLSCYGADRFRTPNIDALAKGGTRYTNAYTAPLCGPSRALILTGRYAFRTGATNQDATKGMTPAKETFMPAILKPAGYVSAAVGKWGQLPLGPAEFGFDEHLKFTGSGTYWNTQDKGRTYLLNGQTKSLRDKEYLPDAMHDFVVNFMTRHQDRPFYLYYSLSHVHGEILPTPDSAPSTTDHYEDNMKYMDKLVGKLVAELDRLKLRDNTLLVFFGDNGTAENYADRSTIGGKRVSGQKGSMLEGGSLVPMIVNWPGKTPAGKMSADLVDSTDFVPTFAALAGAKLPAQIDGHNYAARFRGENGPVREWIFIQLARMWYVRDAKWKLNEKGELFDMSGAPFAEPRAENPAARKRLEAALAKLNPAGGIVDDGDGSGRHAGRAAKRAKKRK